MPLPITEVLERAGRFFMGRSAIHEAARRVAAALDDLGVPYAVAGAMAVNVHGHVRATEDLDLLLSPAGLAAFKQR